MHVCTLALFVSLHLGGLHAPASADGVPWNPWARKDTTRTSSAFFCSSVSSLEKDRKLLTWLLWTSPNLRYPSIATNCKDKDMREACSTADSTDHASAQSL